MVDAQFCVFGMHGSLRSLQDSPLIQVLALLAFVLNITFRATHLAMDHALIGKPLEHVEEKGGMLFPRQRFEVEEGPGQTNLLVAVAALDQPTTLCVWVAATSAERGPSRPETPPGSLRGPPLHC